MLMAVEPVNLADLSAQVDADGAVRMRGTISLRRPSDTLKPFFHSVHKAAVADGLSELRVDITELTFMNSSSIRVLITWLDWIVEEPESRRYVLHFQTNRSFTWQETTFSVLKSLGEENVRISSV